MQSVSVIIPTNRGGPYLKAAVHSVRAQSRAVTEIIIVDDGSPHPGLASLASELDVTYVRQPPLGISAARNTGVAHASGEWIAFLDDDDVWHPDRVAHQLDALAASPDAAASYTGGWYMNSDGEPFGEGWPAPDAPSERLLRGDLPFPRITTLLVRRSLYGEVGGCHSRFEPAEDNELMLRFLLRASLIPVDRPLVGYRRHESNVTHAGLAGRKAALRFLMAHRLDARRRGDGTEAAIYSNLKRFRRSAGQACVADLAAAVHRRDLRGLLRTLTWCVIAIPLESLHAVIEKLVRRAASRQRTP